MKGYLLNFDFLEYKKSLELQHFLVEKRLKNEIPETLILLQHEHVFTIGKRGSEANILEKAAPIYYIERGGDVTYHGPGQLVGYLIFDLKALNLDVKEFVKKIEKSLSYALLKYGLECDQESKLPGVWINGKKIASIGIALKNFVSYHGFALNVNTDLSYFYKIRPCGLSPDLMTSMKKELGYDINIEKVKNDVVEGISKNFGIDFVNADLNFLK
ncbi:MAG: lipoyl(octanoyl) transferase LipB [Thermoproteota archaeon]|jgi:lipoate-protein ligase B